MVVVPSDTILKFLPYFTISLRFEYKRTITEIVFMDVFLGKVITNVIPLMKNR